MTAAELVTRLSRRGISLWSEAGQLHYRAPEGALDDELRSELRLHKTAVLNIVEQRHSTFDTPQLRRVRRDAPIPLSSAQQSLWFLDQLYPHNTGANEQFALCLRGTLETEHLESAWNRLLERHEILRTRFESINGEPRQIIEPATPQAIAFTDLSALPMPLARRQLETAAAGSIREPFNLRVGPLIRARLLRLSGQQHVLLVTAHHIVADGLSVVIMRDELARLYDDSAAGRASATKHSSVQYADFAVAEAKRLRGDWVPNEAEFWRRQLADAPQFVDLPVRPQADPVQTGTEKKLAIHIPAPLADALRDLARAEAATLFMTLLAAFRTLLFRHSGQRDILIGSPVTLRDAPETREMIGCMVNNVVFRTPIDGNRSFRDLLGRERDTAISAYQHSTLPFDRVVEAVGPTRALGRHPLFQVLFLFDDQRQDTVRAQNLEFAVEALPVDRSSYWDLELSFSDHGPGEPLTGFVGYRTDLFDGWFMDAVPMRLQMLLQSIVENPDQTLSRLSMIDSVTLQQLLGNGNDSRAEHPEPSSLHEQFERQVALTPESIAVHAYEGEQLSYRELNQAANQLARFMAERGAGPGKIIGLYLHRSIEGIRSLLAILKTGAAVLPLDPAYPPARLSRMLDEAQPHMIVTNLALSAQLPAEKIPLVCVDGDDRARIDKAADGNLGMVVLPRNPAYVLFTSGSTGRPKGCIGLHSGSVNRVDWMWNAFDFGSADRFAQRTSLNFVDSLWEIFGALGHGVPLVLVPEGLEKDAGELVEFLAERAVTHLVVVPSLLAAMFETDRDLDRDLPALRSLITSGEPLSGTLLQRFRAALPGRRILNTYGTTEFWDATCFDATDWTATEGIVPIGRPLPNVRCYILDASEEPVPPGVWGELHVGSSGFAAEYLNRPDLSEEKYVVDRFSDDPADRLCRTGDLARFLPDGTIEFRGRADRQLKVRGFRVEPAEIEALLDQHPGIEASAVVGQQAASGTAQLVAYLVPCAANAVTDPEVMRRYLKESLPDYLLPDAFVKLEEMPLTPSGKIDRLALPAPGREDRTSRPYVAPRSATESELAAIWADVLDCPKLGVHDDFFRLGGHSLLAVRLMARVSDLLRVDLPLQCLFEAPTVAELGDSVDAIRWTMNQGDDLPGDDREVIRI